MFFSKSAKKKEQTEKVVPLTSDSLLELCRPIYDPDIGVSIVELGLIYNIAVSESAVDVEMTFTTPACPYGPQLVEEVRYTLLSVQGVNEVNVDVVWEPPWSMENISEATRLEMGLDI